MNILEMKKLTSKHCNHLCQNYPSIKFFVTTKVENKGKLSILKNNSSKEVGITYLNEQKNSYLKLLIKRSHNL